MAWTCATAASARTCWAGRACAGVFWVSTRAGCDRTRAEAAGRCPGRLAHEAAEGGGVFVAPLGGHLFDRHPTALDQHARAVEPHALHQRQRTPAGGGL